MRADPTELRRAFSRALSAMYRAEVPAYGTLLEIVGEVNGRRLSGEDSLAERLDEERHGAIRVGTARELNLVGRVFALMGMEPVGYYDLGVAGLPVHSTAFRPVTEVGLQACPFRVFTSLLRLDAVSDEGLREEAREALATRHIFTDAALEHLDRAEAAGGVEERDADGFVRAVLETFRWHETARVTRDVYERLLAVSGLVADIVSFRGPHINHLTPRVLDIAAARETMVARGLDTKETIEGPPERDVPVLLRQTAFKALTEDVRFVGDDEVGGHTARFGEIEQRGAALTRAGMAVYEDALARSQVEGVGAFGALPDDLDELISRGWVYHRDGVVVTYEDFLPVSAAGIFRSNLDAKSRDAGAVGASSQGAFEAALGRRVVNRFGWYDGVVRSEVPKTI